MNSRMFKRLFIILLSFILSSCSDAPNEPDLPSVENPSEEETPVVDNSNDDIEIPPLGTPFPIPPELVQRDPDMQPLIITDDSGKEWDVTEALLYFNMTTIRFQYGLGPFSIPPINNPEMISEGDRFYPDNESDEIVVGTSINGDSRAYPLFMLTRYEIANEVIGGEAVAVGY